jgi:dinuclear metal center YbgI/SA1388 family protein
MVPTVKDIFETLDKIAPFCAAQEWDNSGLQVGTFSQEIRKILISLDPTLEALKEASRRQAELLLTHHPLIFGPLSCIDGDLYPGSVITEAVKKNISILAAHTNLDVALGGINDMLTDLFELQEVKILETGTGQEENGLGRLGNLVKPLLLSEVVGRTKQVLNVQEVGVVGPGDLKIKRIAVVGGSGGGMVALAAQKGADLLITGDISHHEARQAADMGLALLDGGHFSTEKAAIRLFAERFSVRLKEEGWQVLIESYQTEEAPMSYR